MKFAQLSQFLRDRSGNYSAIIALCIVPILGAAGLSVDYYQASRLRSNFQNSADAAALAAARAGSQGNAYIAAADDAFEANMVPLQDASVRASGTKIETVNGVEQFVYFVDYTVKTGLTGILGIAEISGRVVAKASAGAQEVEIALVLDTTGSMASSGKMTELKKAVRLFADEFEGLKSKVQIAVVPFDTQVRLAKVAFGSQVIDAPANPFGETTDCANLPDPADQQSCWDYKSAVVAATGCSTTTVEYYLYKETTKVCATISSGVKYIETTVTTTPDFGVPQVVVTNTTEPFDWGPKVTKPNDVITSNNDLLGVDQTTWTGCVIDRQQPNDVTDKAPTAADSSTLYPAAYCSRPGLQPIQPLTNNLNKIRNLANALTPSGNTNITIGVQWGMEALTKTQPLTGASGKPEVKRYMILLTDGVNTQNRWSYNSGEIDNRTRLACGNVKADKIEFYTVRLIDGNAGLLAECASEPSMFFDVRNATELSGVFKELANRIKKLRLVG